ncbi:hypothetical protein R6Q59_010129 [Mikania micrantha]
MRGTYGESVPGGVGGNANVVIRVTGSPSHIVIAVSYLLIITYALTLAPVAWVYASEVWSLGTRATGMSIAAIGNWLFNFALGLFVPSGFKNITYKIFIIFGILCFGAAIQAFLTYPETCGKTIEEVEVLFKDGSIPPWKTRPGHSRLEQELAAGKEKRAYGSDAPTTPTYIDDVNTKIEEERKG